MPNPSVPNPSALNNPLPLQLLTRAGCGLCEEFEQELAAFAAASGLDLPALQIIDVDADPVLARRYGLDVPVLLWGGARVCQHRLDREELRRLLRPRQAPAPL